MYKQIKPLQPSGKMQVTPEQSVEVQKALFEMGLSWADGQEPRPCEVIYWYGHNKEITWSFTGDSEYFDKHKNPLHIFTDYFTTEPLK